MSDLKKSRVRRGIDKLKSGWNYFENSKIGKILFSNTLSYAISLGGAAIAVSGLFTYVSPIIIALAAASAAVVGVRAINETLKIHSLRKLHKENNLLVQNRNAKSQQDYILSLELGLNNILKNELYIPLTENKSSELDKYNIKSKNLDGVSRVVAHNLGLVAYTASSIIEGASGNVIAILKATGYGVLTGMSLINDGLSEKEKRDIETVLKLNINEEFSKKDTPNYKNLSELEECTKKQIIQTLVLKKLITDQHYWTMSDKDKQQRFHEIKNSFELEIEQGGLKDFLTKNKLALDTKKQSYIKDFGRVINPFYKKPNKAVEYTPLSNAMNNIRNSNGKKKTPTGNLSK